MKIGVFLGYGPQARLSNEGLGRYLGGLIKGFTEADIPTVIVAPKWSKNSLINLFREIDIDESAVDIITTKSDPIVWRLYEWLSSSRLRKHPKITAFVKKYLKSAILYFAKTSTKNFWVYLPLYFLMFLACLVFALPLAVIGALLIAAKILFRKATRRTRNLTKDNLDEDNDSLFLEVFYSMTNTVVEQLVEIVNNKVNCDIWYVPSLFWPQVNQIRKPIVINAPDLVSAVYPAEFADAVGMRKATEDVKKTIEGGRFFITYCEYIRQSLLLRDYSKKPENVIAIPHVNNTSKPFIDIDLKRAKELNSNKEYDVELSKKLLNKMVSKSCPKYYNEKFNFDGIHYVFYASQIRPHKNIITLLKAFEYLIRERNVHIKLILTGDVRPDSNLPASQFIYERGLEKEVLSFSGVSATTLSALYRCADLVINPSMYEGGFAFTFGEGMSVGTPSLLSNEPFEMDILGPAGLEEVTFDPTDWKKLAEKIEYWLPRRKELYKKELPLYEELAKRTPEVVANDYIQAFQYFLEKSKVS